MDSLKRDIQSGRYRPGQKLPSEAALLKKFDTSRITVGRALRELQNRGFIIRRAGSGTYVAESDALPKELLFGLLIPDLGQTEIFDPICRGLANSPLAGDHALLWGHTDTNVTDKADECWRLCQQFISRRVNGVFFAPLEFEPESIKTNRRVLAAFRSANIPVVLLDRGPEGKVGPTRFDLVGLNNHQAGYVAAEHLIQHGCQHIGFVALQGSERVVAARQAGYLDALRDHNVRVELPFLQADEASSSQSAQTHFDGIVCGNDRTAALLMRAYSSQGLRVPQDMRLVGIDDVPYASLLPVPLTTVKQPCLQIGEAAMQLMMDRMRQPQGPVREILLNGELVLRQSCGMHNEA